MTFFETKMNNSFLEPLLFPAAALVFRDKEATTRDTRAQLQKQGRMFTLYTGLPSLWTQE